MTADPTTRPPEPARSPVRVLWLLANDRSKADTISLVRWVRAADPTRLALTVAFLSSPSGQVGPAGEFDHAGGHLTIPDALCQAGAAVAHWPEAGWLSPRAIRQQARWLLAERFEIIQSVYLRADAFSAGLARVLADRAGPGKPGPRPLWVVRASGIGRYRRVRLYGCSDCLDRVLYRPVDHFVAVSEAVRRDWSSRLARPDSDFTIIHNSAPVPPRPAPGDDRSRIRQRYGVGRGPRPRLVVSVGRLDREKGLELLLDAAARLRSARPEARSVILGGGPWRARLERMADRLGLAGKFFLAGDRADVWAHLASADLFVLPSRMEGCPNALLEAASAGLPIVASAVGGVVELVRHEQEALLVDPGQGPGGLADAVGRVMDSPVLPDLSVPPDIQAGNDDPLYLLVKRTLGILLTVAVLPAAVVLGLLVAAAIKLTSPGPVLFRQRRAGKDGRPFWCLKFRSMIVGAADSQAGLDRLNVTKGPTFKVPDDPRVTRLGRFLRRSSLDELPQLLHVLSGKMSLVGPRPLPLAEVRSATVAERIRLRAKPGLTGLWQVSGRSEIPYAEWVELDCCYARHRSTLLDLQILLQTIPAVLSARGAY